MLLRHMAFCAESVAHTPSDVLYSKYCDRGRHEKPYTEVCQYSVDAFVQLDGEKKKAMNNTKYAYIYGVMNETKFGWNLG